MSWIVWLAIAAALGAAEFFVFTLAFGLLGAAALVAAVVAGFSGNLLLQLLSFTAASAVGLLVVRPIAQRQLRQAPLSLDGSDALIGRRGTVLREVTSEHGLIKLVGEEWSARAIDDALVIPVGTAVDVLSIEGATAIVLPRDGLPEEYRKAGS